MSKSNKDSAFLEMLDTIKRKTGKTEEKISEEVGRQRAYIAQLKSRLNNGGHVSDKFIELLKLQFGDILKDGASDEVARLVVLSQELRDINEKLILLQATVNVFGVTLEQYQAQRTGTEAALISSQLQQAIKAEVDRLISELRKK